MDNKMMWGFMIKFGSNMWQKPGQKFPDCMDEELRYKERMFCDRNVWRSVTDVLPSCGINTLLIDVGEGIKLDSHPELAVQGSWDKSEFKEELERLREIGLTPIPKLNFSSGHNAWLGEYSYMVGSQTYYQVCEEVLLEVMELFGYPEFFHLGLEEETYPGQQFYPVITIRQPYKQIEDAGKLFQHCFKHNVRPWMWIDAASIKGFGGDECFRENIPKEVLISNWYYRGFYDGEPNERILLYNKLGEWGYEQVPTCSNWSYYLNSRHTMRYCKETIDKSSIRGYLTAPWLFTIPDNYYGLIDAAHLFGQAKKRIYPEYAKDVTHMI